MSDENPQNVRKTVSTWKTLKIQVYYDQTNIEVHSTKAIRKCQFRITQGDTDTVQEKDIHAILPCPILGGVYGFEKDIDVDLIQLDLFPSHYIDFLFTDGHATDTVKPENVKVQNSVGLKYKFYKSDLEGIFILERLQLVQKFESKYTTEKGADNRN